MNNYDAKRWEFDKEKVQMTIPDNPMQDPLSIHLIHTKIDMEITDIMKEFTEDIPFITSVIQFTIDPKDNIRYYSFSGIQDILNKLFKHKNNFIEQEILNIDTFLKVYLIYTDLFVIPSIKIEIILLKELSEDAYDIFNDFLKNELFKLIGNFGSIHSYEINHPLKLKHILNIPLLVGQPQFKMEGIYEKLGFSNYQLNELNYLLTNTLIKLDFEEIIENVFSHLKLVIYSEEEDRKKNERIKKLLIDLSLRGDNNLDFELGELGEIRYILSQQNDEDSGLPF